MNRFRVFRVIFIVFSVLAFLSLACIEGGGGGTDKPWTPAKSQADLTPQAGSSSGASAPYGSASVTATKKPVVYKTAKSHSDPGRVPEGRLTVVPSGECYVAGVPFPIDCCAAVTGNWCK